MTDQLPDLQFSLSESSIEVLHTIARFWGFDAGRLLPKELAFQLVSHMLIPEVAETAWKKLTDEQRQGLQTLLGSKGKMAQAMAERILGKIRKMGTTQVEKENPLDHPISVAEALYYRGLIYEAFEHVASGMRMYWYIPQELLAILPTHITGYDNLDEDGDVFVDDDAETHAIDPLEGTITPRQTADTSLVDDAVALLAYIQVRGGKLEGVGLADDDRVALAPQLLHDDEARLTFLLNLCLTAGLIEVQDTHLYVKRVEARKWLEEKRSVQLQALINAWMTSKRYKDLWHIPGLHPQPGDWEYHPKAGREAIRDFLRDFTPRGAWWSITDFITAIKETEPDFQRPNGNYNLWYIQNDDGEFLDGFENWDAVDGATLEFYLNYPMYWLGMVDLAEDAVRLNAYGRAFVGWEQFPNAPDPEEPMHLQNDGTLLISRKVSRIDRFQAMRFTSWEGKASLNAPYSYRLTPESIRRANEQEITAEHIATFLKRIINNTQLPVPILKLLQTGQSSASATVTLERVLVLRSTSTEVMDYIVENPSLRRYCGARLGDMAVVVRSDQWEALRTALEEKNIAVELIQ